MTILGPPDTLYEGGFFNAIMKFPKDYPQSPPECRFTSEMWHPNGGRLGAGLAGQGRSVGVVRAGCRGRRGVGCGSECRFTS